MIKAQQPASSCSSKASESRRSVDPLFTLHVPPDAIDKNSQPSVLGAPGRRDSVSSVCFLPVSAAAIRPVDDSNEEDTSQSSGDTDDEDDEELVFRCRRTTTTLAEKYNKSDNDDLTHRAAMDRARDTASSLSLAGTFLASSHANGDSFLWDLGRRRIVSNFCSARNRGSGLALRRMGSSGGGGSGEKNESNAIRNNSNVHVLYHTRDGTVSIHNMEAASSNKQSGDSSSDQSYIYSHSSSSARYAYRYPSCPIVTEFQTNSHTFCAASPCAGNPHLVALPSRDEAAVTVRDVRVSSTSSPIFSSRGSGNNMHRTNIAVNKRQAQQHGMLTSLAMSTACSTHSSQVSHSSASRPIVACGMESGTVFFHDLAMPGRPFLEAPQDVSSNSHDGSNADASQRCCSLELSKNPVLALDLVPSVLPTATVSSGSTFGSAVLAIAGMAGDAADLMELPESERGTIAVVKTVLPSASSSSDALPMQARLRARLSTCRVGSAHDNDVVAGGKPGVSICRFRPDGRIFAVGGWDKRLRIFDRARTSKSNSDSSATPLAILRAHSDSVTAMDWSLDATVSGMLATGAGDGRICLWNCNFLPESAVEPLLE